ncbi:MAG: transcriptional repressor LexA [Ignavibacteriae bacterium]|nr:transcriptional repressor LexA [Ignavibacteriota bacterium]
MMKKPLTDRQNSILNFIKEHLEENGYPPTYREIGKQFKISSTFGVKRHIDALAKKGYLNYESNQSRTLSVNENNGNTKVQPDESIQSIPIVGRVAAGYPIFAEENIEGTLKIDASLIKNSKKCFGLKVRGESMINAGILDGDLVMVKTENNANNGDIVIALLGDESTMKRYHKDKNTLKLLPENNDFDPIDVTGREDFKVVGKVIGVYRGYY